MMIDLRRLTLGAGLVALAGLASAAPAAGDQIEARVWLDRGHEPVVHRGDRVRLYYRTNQDAYVAIFRLDTNGSTRLVYPRSPYDRHLVRGGRDYRLTFPNSSYWLVADDPGVGYYFAIASPTPFDYTAFDYGGVTQYSSYGSYGWDLGEIYRTVYHDPYVAMDDLVAALVPNWRYSPYALDFATYHVGSRYDYPRFLCYDCHGFRSFSTWNPYLVSCTNFRVVIYNDPYYYPAYRYRGQRVVYVRPPVYRQPRYVFKERAYGEVGQPVRRARPAVAVASPSVPPPPAGRGLDGRVRRANPSATAAQPRRGEPLRAPGRTTRPAVPSVRAPDTRAGASPEARPGGGARPAVPTLGGRPSGAPTGATRGDGRAATPGAVLPPGTRPTRVLPGRETTDDLGMRRRGSEGPGSAAPSRSGAARTVPPSRILPQSGVNRPRTTPTTGQVRPPNRVRPPTQSRPTGQARPPNRVRPPTQVRPPSRVRPPTQSRPPARTRPPARPPTSGSARPPARPTRPGGGGARPPTRPTKPGGGGARVPTRPGGL